MTSEALISKIYRTLLANQIKLIIDKIGSLYFS